MDEDEDFEGILEDRDGHVELTVGLLSMVTSDGYQVIEKDYRVKGEVWRVHKYDADPFPSKPHAHCVGGAKRFVGLTLHLGTRELFDGPEPTGRLMHKKQFDRLIELIRPKFPDTVLPIPVDGASEKDQDD